VSDVAERSGAFKLRRVRYSKGGRCERRPGMARLWRLACFMLGGGQITESAYRQYRCAGARVKPDGADVHLGIEDVRIR